MRKLARNIATSLALALAAVGAVTAPAEAYQWTQKYYAASTGTYWAYKVCTREEWFNGCTNGWYTAKYHWSLWG